jgi:hypothetical protein
MLREERELEAAIGAGYDKFISRNGALAHTCGDREGSA